MFLNLRQFNRELDHWARTVPPEAVSKFQRKVAIDLFGAIVRRTPVDTGRARGNWQLTVNESPEDEVPVALATEAGKAPEAALVRAAEKLSRIPDFSVIYITNNVPYILPLENGHSKQAPTGMVAVSLEEIRGQLEAVRTA